MMVNKKKISKKNLIIFLVSVLIIGVFIYLCCYNKTEIIIKSANTTEKNVNIIQEFLEGEQLEEEELSINNSNYELNKNTLKITEYTGTADCIIIENNIDGVKVKNLEIDEEAFSDSSTLEMVKISSDLVDSIIELDSFEVSTTLSDSEYIVYITTREYTDAYLAYQDLTEEEKEQLDIIPGKFEITLSASEAESLYSDVATSSIPSSFDLREGSDDLEIDPIEIGVEDQYDSGICYSYATLTSVETYISKYFSVNEDFSELHLAILSEQGYAGNFYYSYYNYLQPKYGPIDESFLSIESAYSAYNSSSSSSAVEALTYLYCTSSYSDVSSTELETIQENAEELIDNKEYDVSDYVEFTTITGAMKSDSEYDETVEENRQNIKSQILKYGSVFAAIDVENSSGSSKVALVKSTGDYTLYVSSDTKDSTVDHAISIIGWDDDFSKDYFVDEEGNTPTSDGAWLCLNSWGDDWGDDDGCFWVSYEDYYIEYYVCGITEVTLEITEDNVEVTLDETEYTYDGNEKEPEITVTFEENTLTEGTDYTVTYSDNIDAGTATVTITGMGNYTGTITKEFTINKAENPLEVVAISDLVYNGSKQTLVTVSNAQGEVYYSLIDDLDYSNYLEDGSTSIPTGTDAGEYEISYYSPGDSNYNEISGYIEVEIDKADPEYTVPTGLIGLVGYVLASIDLPDGFGWDDWSLEMEEAGTFTYTVSYVPDDDDNYNTITGIEVTVTVYAELTITVNEYTISREDTDYCLEGIYVGDSVETVLGNIETNGDVTVYYNDGEEVTDYTTNAASGMQVLIEKDIGTEVESMEYVLVVKGDLNGDGLVNSIDLLKLSRFLTALDDDITGAYFLAANIYDDDAINKVDLLKLARILVSLDEF